MRPSSTSPLRLLLAVLLGVCLVVAAGCAVPAGDAGDEPSLRLTPPDGAVGADDAEDDPGAPESLVDADCPGRDLVPSPDNRAEAERATLCLINAERTRRGREPLTGDGELAQAARAKSRDMVRRDYFAHVGPDERDVRDWVADTAYLADASGYALGENLAWISGSGATPERIVLGWMRSEGHRRNLLSRRYGESGIGVALGSPLARGGGGAAYTHMLGRRGPSG